MHPPSSQVKRKVHLLKSTHCGHSSFQATAGRNLSDIFTLAGDMAAPPLAGIDPEPPLAIFGSTGRCTLEAAVR